MQVCFEFVESVEHVRADAQHRASDACMFMCTGRAVGPPAGPKFDFTFVEMLFELAPFLGRDGAVFLGVTLCPAAFKVLLVVTDHVLVEHCDVAAGCLQIGVTEQGGSDVDGKAIVDELGGEQSFVCA